MRRGDQYKSKNDGRVYFYFGKLGFPTGSFKQVSHAHVIKVCPGLGIDKSDIQDLYKCYRIILSHDFFFISWLASDEVIVFTQK